MKDLRQQRRDTHHQLLALELYMKDRHFDYVPETKHENCALSQESSIHSTSSDEESNDIPAAKCIKL